MPNPVTPDAFGVSPRHRDLVCHAGVRTDEGAYALATPDNSRSPVASRSISGRRLSRTRVRFEFGYR